MSEPATHSTRKPSSSAEGPPPTHEGPGAREKALAREPSRFRRLFKLLGPGIISGASDEDPATIGTCSQIGAALGFATLWTMPLILPLMATVQYLTAKIGLVTGRGLAGVLREHYPRWVLYPTVLALVIANTINAGADLGGIAAAINLLVPAIPLSAAIIPVAAVLVALQVWGSYRLIERIFKWLTLALFAYVGAALLVRPDARDLLSHTFIPTLEWNHHYLEALLAIAGTTFSPYLYFWQSSQEVEEKIAMGRKKLWQRRGTTDTELTYAAWDVNIGMTLSVVVNYAIIVATGATLHRAGQHDVQSAAEAAKALEPLAGNAAEVLLAIGLMGAGFLAVPVLTTSAAYAVSEAFGWKRGLDNTPSRAPRFYLLITFATLAGMEINFIGINPIDALYWTSILYGLLAPPLLIILMLVSSSRRIMGERVNGLWVGILGWTSALLTVAAAIGMVTTWVLIPR